MVFGSRKEKLDTKKSLSDEFVRLDFLDLTASNDSVRQFSEALCLMGKLDECFSRVVGSKNRGRFQNWIDIFGRQSACVGFIVSTAVLMLGRPGNAHSKESLCEKWNNYKNSLLALIKKMNKMNAEELSVFLELPVLSEKLGAKKRGKVGDFETEYFKLAFLELYEKGESLSSFAACWNAY